MVKYLLRKTIYTFKKQQLKYYIEKRSQENIKVLSLAQIERIGLIEFKNDYDIYLDIDLTSTIKLLLIDEKASSYGVESTLQFFDEFNNVQFLIEESYLDDLFDSFPHIFSSTALIELDDEKIIQDITMNHENWSSKEKKKIVDLDSDKILGLIGYINSELSGHYDLKKDIESKIKEFKYFFEKVKDQPIISFFLLGPSGLGKTELARVIHNYLDRESPLAKINFGNYSNEGSLASLIGSPPGYRNSEQDSDLIIKIKNSNTGVLVIDEFEKANKSIHNFFLQLLEEGKFDDAMGRVFDLSGYVLIFTSNLNRDEFVENLSPELRSRFNGVYLMKELSEVEKETYAKNVINWYFKVTKEEMNHEKVEEILKKVDYKSERNLRTLKLKIRSAFYKVNNQRG